MQWDIITKKWPVQIVGSMVLICQFQETAYRCVFGKVGRRFTIVWAYRVHSGEWNLSSACAVLLTDQLVNDTAKAAPSLIPYVFAYPLDFSPFIIEKLVEAGLESVMFVGLEK